VQETWLTGITGSANANDFILRGKDGYNNMIQTLNKISGNYINTTFAHSATSARSVGTARGSTSISVGPTANYIPDANQDGWSEAALANLNGMMAEDTLHTVDTNALQTAGMRATEFDYWLGSRNIFSGTTLVYFYGRIELASGPVAGSGLWRAGSAAGVGTSSYSVRGSSGNPSKV
jgi:hypothetical protein